MTWTCAYHTTFHLRESFHLSARNEFDLSSGNRVALSRLSDSEKYLLFSCPFNWNKADYQPSVRLSLKAQSNAEFFSLLFLSNLSLHMRILFEHISNSNSGLTYIHGKLTSKRVRKKHGINRNQKPKTNYTRNTIKCRVCAIFQQMKCELFVFLHFCTFCSLFRSFTYVRHNCD